MIRKVYISPSVQQKIWEIHRVEAWEVFDIFYNRLPKARRSSGRTELLIGMTRKSRMLAIFFIQRNNTAHVRTAYDATEDQRRFYREYKEESEDEKPEDK
ncbi:hypothetical protein HYR99_12600 [Candidatus Poribacteria bacterium]|nr:hypothetical protein [Candidatus Poribacteria bacterium]